MRSSFLLKEHFLSASDRSRSLLIKPSIVQWSAIHAVAKQFKMDMIGAFATKQMGNTLDLVERVLSIHRFGMQDQWAKNTYDLFYHREEPISAEEGERLGAKTWADLNARREHFLRNMWEECQCTGTSECVPVYSTQSTAPSSGGAKKCPPVVLTGGKKKSRKWPEQ